MYFYNWLSVGVVHDESCIGTVADTADATSWKY